MEQDQALSVLTLLHDEMRRRLYYFVRRSGRPVTRDEAAKEVSISAKLAAFHLDKLVQGGLLEADFSTPPGLRRRVGRAPKRYRTSSTEVSLSLPERRYDLVGEILVDALGGLDRSSEPFDVARKVAFERGRTMGAARREELRRGRLGAERTMGEVRLLLDELGFEPADGSAEILLRNCPFHALAKRRPDLVCGLNLAFLDGMLRGLGNDTVTADLVPQPGHCCVRLRPPITSSASRTG